MTWWEWLLQVAGLALLLAVASALGLVLRRRLLARHGGTFELSHRLGHEGSGRGWILGLGRYSGERLEWFRIFSLYPGPKATWAREELTYDGRRQPMSAEQASLYPDHLVIRCDSPDGEVEFAMSAASLMGFQAWLEARPPGTDWTRLS